MAAEHWLDTFSKRLVTNASRKDFLKLMAATVGSLLAADARTARARKSGGKGGKCKPPCADGFLCQGGQCVCPAGRFTCETPAAQLCCGPGERCDFQNSRCEACPNGQQACGTSCCAPPFVCPTGSLSCVCPAGRTRCESEANPALDSCCQPDEACDRNTGQCLRCPQARQACGNKCCPQDAECVAVGQALLCRCPNGGRPCDHCCEPNEICGGTLDNPRCIACKAGEQPCGGIRQADFCCPAGKVCSGDDCGCPSGKKACGEACCDALCAPEGGCCAAARVCNGGGLDFCCPLLQTCCQGQCKNLLTDRQNCGQCGRACPLGQSCLGGQCLTDCPPGQTPCSGVCRDLQTDSRNCGECGMICPTGLICRAGSCGCGSGLKKCGNICCDQSTCCCVSNGGIARCCAPGFVCKIGCNTPGDDGACCRAGVTSCCAEGTQVCL